MENETNIPNTPIKLKIVSKTSNRKLFGVSLILGLFLSYPLSVHFKIVSSLLVEPSGWAKVFFDVFGNWPSYILYSPFLALFENMGEGALGLALLIIAVTPFFLFLFWVVIFFVTARIFKLVGEKSLVICFLLPGLFVVAVNVITYLNHPQPQKNPSAALLEEPFARAELKKDVTICNEIKEQKPRDGCFYNFANSDGTKDMEISKTVCDMIADPELVISCHAERKEPVTLEQCAILSKSLSSAVRTNAYRSCLSTYAFISKDINTCNLPQYNAITPKGLKAICMWQVALSTQNPEICETLPAGTSVQMKGLCFMQVAEVSKNLSLCDNLNDLQSKNSCIRIVAVAKNDPTICLLLREGDVSRHNSCISEIAKNTHNPSVCAQLVSREHYPGDEYKDCEKAAE